MTKIKISIIGPGIMSIPPKGWGAVETLIWDMRNALIRLGCEVDIINLRDSIEIIKQVNLFKPDFVHIHYDDWVVLYPYIQYPCACTSHFGYLERPKMFGGYVNTVNTFSKIKPRIFCLSEGIKNVYKVLMNISEDKLYITPNGVNCNAFRNTDTPKYSDRSLYLAKIDYRKRQHMFQSIDSLWYAGNIADNRFNQNKNYLGEWSKETLYNNLTEYGNLVLLSDGEAHPLVCMEALAAGLGVVVCQWGAANLDTSKEFITVIPENKISDIAYVESKIIENREYSRHHRKDILEYSKQFDWINVMKDIYVPIVEKIVSESK